MMDAMAMMTIFLGAKALAAGEKVAAVPEPKFERFHFPKHDVAAVRAEAMAPANTSRGARTLEELGVPSGLARELELALGVAGFTKGDRVTGFTFRTPDGATHALKTSKPSALPGAEPGELAA